MKMVNICDAELLDKTVQSKNLKMHISKDYFGHELMNEQDTIDILRKCPMANLVGKRIIDRVLSEKLASPSAVKTIEEVPFLMIYNYPKA
jgi:hypothetical protein